MKSVQIVKLLCVLIVIFLMLRLLGHKPAPKQLPQPAREETATSALNSVLPTARQTAPPVPMVTPVPAVEAFKPLQNSVVFSRFEALDEKVLLTSEEQHEKDKLLSNPERLNDCERVLLSTNPAEFSREGHKLRFKALHFIERALEWQSNPLRSEIVQRVEKLIETPIISATLPMAIKRSIAGDKAELYAMLNKAAPEKAAEMLMRMHGTPLEKILQYSKTRLSF